MPSPSVTPRAHDSGVEVCAPARFHLGMFSFGDATVRSFGGTGLMLAEPATVVRVRRAADWRGDGPGADRAVGFARAAAATARLPEDAAFDLEVVRAPRPHVGLGSGTQLALAVAAAVEALSGPSAATMPRECGIDSAHALRLSRAAGRGRRSSVGAYGFAFGGLVVEAGRLGADRTAAPEEVSPLVAATPLPEAWRGVLVVEHGREGLQGDAERAAFLRLPPVDRGLTAELTRIALLELVPAAIEGRFGNFASALGAYGRLAGEPFAAESEALPYHAAILRLLDRLAALGFPGAAQSSWGPAVLACCPGEAEAAGLAAALAADGLAATHAIDVVRFAREGARLRVTD